MTNTHVTPYGTPTLKVSCKTCGPDSEESGPQVQRAGEIRSDVTQARLRATMTPPARAMAAAAPIRGAKLAPVLARLPLASLPLGAFASAAGFVVSDC